ncbi:hypothetical protein [Robiginitalea sp. SC105]|uniref:hypothetical protein n=1 Tax=Robiginitalea sp. SC105 TaxID=2762332 RepID=UPI00163AA7AD|nr:hypothetical protein [Robiginitalea sp. SC105]MBC2838387.1 hypothetical protein [Robiginitalea sp. SC105]
MKRCLYFFLGLVAALLLAVFSNGSTAGDPETFEGTETASVRTGETNWQMSDAAETKIDEMNPKQVNP